jgi:hypothetical protein
VLSESTCAKMKEMKTNQMSVLVTFASWKFARPRRLKIADRAAKKRTASFCAVLTKLLLAQFAQLKKQERISNPDSSNCKMITCPAVRGKFHFIASMN